MNRLCAWPVVACTAVQLVVALGCGNDLHVPDQAESGDAPNLEGNDGGREAVTKTATFSGSEDDGGEQSVAKIVFHSDRDGNAEIYIMSADGTGVTRLTDNTARDVSPSFPLLQKKT